MLYFSTTMLSPVIIAQSSPWRALPEPHNLEKTQIQEPMSSLIQPPAPNREFIIELSTLSLYLERGGEDPGEIRGGYLGVVIKGEE